MQSPKTQDIGVAKAEHVALILEGEIRRGQAPRGTALASETELTRRFAVSRNTVRRGLKLLVGRGLITTRVGIGSFVTYDGSTIDGAQGWSVALSRAGGEVETRLLTIRRGPCARADAFRDDGAGGDYLCVDRMRFCRGTGQGISLERSRLPWREGFEALLETGLPGGSINSTLSAFGLIPASGCEGAGVLPALAEPEAKVLGRSPGTPMLRLERLVRDAEGACIEYVESLLDPAHFGLRVEF